jgi:hypothetical protein
MNVQLLQTEQYGMSKGQQQAGSAWPSIMAQAADQRDTENQLVQLGYTVTKYSDELANGDEADDKDIHEEEDYNDDVVDVNGQTNAGYASPYQTQSTWVGVNHIMEGSHITEPRLIQIKKHHHHHKK